MVEFNEEITKAGADKEILTLEIALAAKVGRTALTLEEYVLLRQSQGATMDAIRQDLLTDLEEGGRIFGEFRNALRPTFKGSLNRFRDVGGLGQLGVKLRYRWVAILVNTCPDCLDRHNQVKSWEDWEADGLPRTNATVCEQHCKCMLVPEKIAEMLPIYRGKN